MITELKLKTELGKMQWREGYNRSLPPTFSTDNFLNPPAETFNKFGLRYPISHLEKIGTGLIFLPVDLMADYVDFITKTAIDKLDKEFIESSINEAEAANIADYYDELNATSVGNLAYMYLHVKNDVHKAAALAALNYIHRVETETVNAIKN